MTHDGTDVDDLSAAAPQPQPAVGPAADGVGSIHQAEAGQPEFRRLPDGGMASYGTLAAGANP